MEHLLKPLLTNSFAIQNILGTVFDTHIATGKDLACRLAGAGISRSPPWLRHPLRNPACGMRGGLIIGKIYTNELISLIKLVVYLINLAPATQLTSYT